MHFENILQRFSYVIMARIERMVETLQQHEDICQQNSETGVENHLSDDQQPNKLRQPSFITLHLILTLYETNYNTACFVLKNTRQTKPCADILHRQLVRLISLEMANTRQ